MTIIPGLQPVNGTLAEIWLSHTMFSLPLAVFLLHNFIAQLPESLIEAARVDGASHLRIFRSIVLPLSMPAIASFAIFQFLWVWNDLLVRQDLRRLGRVRPADHRPAAEPGRQLRPPPGAARRRRGFIAIIIPLIVFLSLQRFFVRGLLAGSVKG